MAEAEARAAGRPGTQTTGEHVGRRGALRVLLQYVRPHKGLVAITALTILLDMTGMLFVPTQLSAMVNAAIGGEGVAAVQRAGLGMLVASVVGSGGAMTSSYFAARLAAATARDLRVAVYESSLSFSGSDFEEFGAGTMITRVLSDVNVIQQSLLMGLLMIVPVPVMCAIAVVLAWGIDPVMGMVILGIASVVGVMSVIAVRRSAPTFTRLQGFIDRMNVRLRESITGARVIRAFGHEARDTASLDESFSEYAENAIRVNYIFSVTDALTFFVMNMAEVLIIWLGADRVGAHAMQIGSITALVEYAMIILWYLMMMQFAILQVPRALACLSRAGEVLDLVPQVRDAAELAPMPAPAAELARRDIREDVFRFEHASLRFPDADEHTLCDLDFSLRRGQVTAIIGNTGSGKSTVAKMLMRFHDVTEGSLRFLGTDVRDLPQADLRSRIAYVPQKAWLFSGTIAENLRNGAPDATDVELWHALDVAQADFVRELPDGLATRVAQGGTNFSGGQRQRLAIARALVRRAEVYVFDDSFSALDYKTDAVLRHALADELAGAAQLIIAQRVSTIHDADQIVVLCDGHVVGMGTHDELVAGCPTYREIAESQVRGGACDE